MTRTDFSHPQRMGAGAFFIIFAKLFVSYIVPIASVGIYKFFNSSLTENVGVGITILMCVGSCIGISLIGSLISYFTKKFYIKDGNLIFIHGLINREKTCVPLDRVHSLRTRRGIWYRLLDMRGIIFDTLATRKEEIELILTESAWKRLLSIIEKGEQPQTISLTEPPEYNPSYTVRYPNENLLLAALCQNHLKGMAVLGSILTVLFDNLSDFSENATATVGNYLTAYFKGLLTSPWNLITLLFVTYIGVLLLWLGRVLLRYYDTVMSYDKKILTFTYGMLTRSSCRFFYDKICTIRIKRNLLEKRFGFCTLMLRQALNASAEKEDDNMKLYGTDSSSFFLNWWIGEDYKNAIDLKTAQSGRGAFFHAIFMRILLAISISIILWHYELYVWLIIPILYLLFSLLRGIFIMRHSKITLRSSYLIIHNGAFAEITNFVKYSNLEVVRIRRTPLTKWFHRVSLVLSTSGTTFLVRSIKEADAKVVYEFLLKKAEE